MTLYKADIKDFQNYFATLTEEEQNDVLLSCRDIRNEDLKKSYVKLSFIPRWNLRLGPIYAGMCRCGHPSSRHWDFNNDFKDCKSCECEAFYE